MFYEENINLESSLPRLPFYSTLDDAVCTPEIDSNEHWLYTSFARAAQKSVAKHEFQLVGDQSFHTIPRNSLKVLPDVNVMEIGEEISCISLRYSNNSIFMGSDDQEDAILQTRLITQTQQMTINQSKDDEMSALEFSFLASSYKDIANHQNQRLSTVFSVKQVKNLLRQLRRRHRYQEKVKGHFMIRTEKELIAIKQGYVKPIIQKKTVISGLIIESKEERLKIRVQDDSVDKSKILLQFWRQSEQSWVQATLAAKLKYTKSERHF